MQSLANWKTACFFGWLVLAGHVLAKAQVELVLASSPPFSASNELVNEILGCESSSKLLELLEELIELERNPQTREESRWPATSLQQLSSNNGNLPWTTLPLTGWRWESPTANHGRVILAIEGPLVVTIYQSPRSTIELSVRDYSEGRAVPRGYAGTPRYFAHDSASVQHVSAMSVKHFSHKSPELFKLFYYFAGPTREIVDGEKLPKPVWLPAWAK